MKRHAALAALSRDHHHALVVAQGLKRATNSTAAEAREAFLAYWRQDGQRHFREEEEILLPCYAGYDEADLAIVARVLVDHVRIRRLAQEIDTDAPGMGALHVLGEQLSDHVRREERELFPLIEQSLSDPDLTRLVELLT